MKINYKLDSAFGPTGRTAGYLLIIVGLIMSWYSLTAIILILVGGFVGFTSTSSLIDLEHKRIKLSNNFFGFIKTGEWLNIDPEMKIGIERYVHGWRTYSRSNRSHDLKRKDVRIFLYDSKNKKIMPIMKNDSITLARENLKILSHQLGLKVVKF